MLKTARLIITGILLTGQLLSCRERPENPYVVTTTEQHPWVEAPVGIPSSEAVDAELVLNLAETGQTVEGFGMCFSELSFRALSRLSAEDYEAVMDELFAPGEGMNFTVCRTPIGASDFALKYYSYDDTPGDLSMEHFTIDNDRETLIPLIKDALKRNPSLRIWGSPWCPPSWMKVNRHYACRPIQGFPSRGKSLKLGNVTVDNGLTPGQVMHEGEDSFLQEEAYLEAYARYFQKYIRAYRDEGVDIFMVMPQNEFNSDQKTADDLTIFLNDYSKELYLKYKDVPTPDGLLFPPKSNQKMNDQLKEIAKILGFTREVTKMQWNGVDRVIVTEPLCDVIGTHAARRTFVVHALEEGMSPQIVMTFTGHEDYDSLKPYIAITDKTRKNLMTTMFCK